MIQEMDQSQKQQQQMQMQQQQQASASSTTSTTMTKVGQVCNFDIFDRKFFDVIGCVYLVNVDFKLAYISHNCYV